MTLWGICGEPQCVWLLIRTDSFQRREVVLPSAPQLLTYSACVSFSYASVMSTNTGHDGHPQVTRSPPAGQLNRPPNRTHPLHKTRKLGRNDGSTFRRRSSSLYSGVRVILTLDPYFVLIICRTTLLLNVSECPSIFPSVTWAASSTTKQLLSQVNRYMWECKRRRTEAMVLFLPPAPAFLVSLPTIFQGICL